MENAEGGKTLLGGKITDILRSDVNTTYSISGNHGYRYEIPNEYLIGYQKFFVYGINTGEGSNPQLGGSPYEGFDVGGEADFEIVVLPDTQMYTYYKEWQDRLVSQIDWIIKNKDKEKIKMVLHVGDLTHKSEESEWQIIQKQMLRLESAGIPWLTTYGNHDTDFTNSRFTERLMTKYNNYFPVSRYKSKSYFYNEYEEGKTDNVALKMKIGGKDWIFVSLEHTPRDAVLAWAKKIMADNPDSTGMVVTHAYLNYTNNWSGEKSSSGDANSGKDIWNELVYPSKNIRMVVNGHDNSNIGAWGTYGKRVEK